MDLQISFRNMHSSDFLQGFIQEKSQTFNKYFDGKLTLKWIISAEKLGKVAHCHITGNQMDYFAEADTSDFRGSIEEVIDKLERQIRKHKEILKDHLHKNRSTQRISA